MSDTPRPVIPERYEDRGAFAQGGSAAIHLTLDRVLGRSVAMKINRAPEPHHLERFRREACITAQLEHPNIVPVYDLGNAWFTMKRIEGQTISSIVRSETFGPVYLSRMIDVAIKVCDALGFAHDRQVIHRDLKPENVMVGRFGQVYLMDWGIAQVAGHSDSPYVGTTAWVAPEQSRGEVCDARTDVWGVGGLLYFILCGGRPNQGKEPEDRLAAARAGMRPLSPNAVAPSRILPAELVRVTMKALDPNPAGRYPSTAALAADLDAVRSGGWWFELRSFPVDTEIVREGDEADAAYILVSGAVEVRQNGGPIAELGPGEVFGETALLVGGPRTASVHALTDVVTRVVTREALDAELGRDRWMGALVRGLARRFQELSLDNLDKK